MFLIGMSKKFELDKIREFVKSEVDLYEYSHYKNEFINVMKGFETFLQILNITQISLQMVQSIAKNFKTQLINMAKINFDDYDFDFLQKTELYKRNTFVYFIIEDYEKAEN